MGAGGYGDLVSLSSEACARRRVEEEGKVASWAPVKAKDEMAFLERHQGVAVCVESGCGGATECLTTSLPGQVMTVPLRPRTNVCEIKN